MLLFQGLVSEPEISPKFHAKKGVKNGKVHADAALLGRGADFGGRRNSCKIWHEIWAYDYNIENFHANFTSALGPQISRLF